MLLLKTATENTVPPPPGMDLIVWKSVRGRHQEQKLPDLPVNILQPNAHKASALPCHMKLDHVLAGTAITQAVSFAGRGSFHSRQRSSCLPTLTLIAISNTEP